MPCNHERQLTLSQHKSALPEYTPWNLPSVSSRVLSNDSRCDATQGRSHTAGEVLPEHKESPEPQSLFEMSANFFPEVYTTDQRLPRSCLVVISSFEEHLVENSKRNLYRLFYLKSRRQWCRVNISIRIPRRSKYWAASKTSRDEFKTTETSAPEVYATLPYSLITQIQPALLTLPSVEQVRTCFSKITRLRWFEINSYVYLCNFKGSRRPLVAKSLYFWLFYYINSADASQPDLGRQNKLHPIRARQHHHRIPSTESYNISYPIFIFGCLARRPDFLGRHRVS